MLAEVGKGLEGTEISLANEEVALGPRIPWQAARPFTAPQADPAGSKRKPPTQIRGGAAEEHSQRPQSQPSRGDAAVQSLGSVPARRPL